MLNFNLKFINKQLPVIQKSKCHSLFINYGCI